MKSFTKDFSNCQIYRLEQNYRSSGVILAAANGLIEHNQSRMGKRLWTADNQGERIHLFAAYNEQDEARFVVDQIKQWTREGRKRQEIAILYRSNAQSPVFEELFIAQNIPYRVYGGLRFFDRAEIKDALSYLRLTVNRSDDASFDRIVNLPTRGIGNRSMALLRECARDNEITLWEAAHMLLDVGELNTRAANAVKGFLSLIEAIAYTIIDLPLDEQIEYVINKSGLKDHYGREVGEKGQSRIDNLDELVNAGRSFNFNPEQHGNIGRLEAFLSHAALEAGEGQGENWEDCVQLMTLHSAKGLEFPRVLMVGMEEGLFPHRMAIEAPGRLEEERRLCYVGITRTREQLVMSYAETRRHFGADSYFPPSRFIKEIPAELITELRPRVTIKPTRQSLSDTAVNSIENNIGLEVGQRVTHTAFGEGVVLDCEGSGQHTRVQVKFEDVGSKWLVLAYANLQTLG